MARRQKTAAQPRSVWVDPTVTENAEAPAYKKELAQLKWKRRALNVIAFGAIPGIFLMGAGMMAQASTPIPDDSGTASITVNGSKGKSEAFRAVTAWLNTTPSPLPGGTIVSWDGFVAEEAPEPTSDQESPASYFFETHAFTVTNGTNMWRADIQVVVDNILGASSTAPPSLTPILDVVVSAANPWFALEPATAAGPVQQAVDAWAAAFTGGDSDTLHQIVQDRNTERSYVPLYGVQELIGAEITASGAKLLAEEGTGIVTDTIVVRVELSFWWEGGKPTVSDTEQDPIPTPVSYDLLVLHADTATPVVVAWGAPGSGPNLTAYENAVQTLVERPKDGLEESPAPTSTEAPADSIDGEESE